MKANQSRLVLWSFIVLLVFIGVAYSLWPKAVQTDLATLQSGELNVSILEEGRTRVHDIYVLSAPVAGHLTRIHAEVGDIVEMSKTIVATIEPNDPAFLDPRTEAQAKADIETARSSKAFAEATVTQAEAELEFALSEFTRIREFGSTDTVSERELDNAERIYKTRRAGLATAQAGLQMSIFEVQRAQANLMSPANTTVAHGLCACVSILAPISGRVLKVLNKSEGVVIAGTPLVEIGDPKNLEIIVELLSFDAVKVQPGQKVNITNWGGEEDLLGRVSQIEPIGFKKVSALGIEEQRVNVIVSFASDASRWLRLGHGYQLDVQILLWQGTDSLTVPVTALFRVQRQWAIYAVKNSRVERRLVQVGRRNNFMVEILSGLNKGDTYVVHPNDQIKEGVKVLQLETESEF
jgi:HlyD family secretion protein